MKFAFFLLVVIAAIPMPANGKSECSEEPMNANSELTFVSCKDYYMIEKVIPFSRNGKPSIRKDFLTSYIKQQVETKSRNKELLSVHKEIKRLSSSNNVGVAVPVDSQFYDLESSYHGRIESVRIYLSASPTNKAGEKWLKDAYRLYEKMYIAIVEQIAPNETKQ